VIRFFSIVLRQVVLIWVSVFVCAGCATSDYLANRGRDAADILTLTVGKGGGVSGRAGPIHCGLFFGVDHVGLKCGELQTDWTDQPSPVWSALFDPLLLLPGGDGVSFYEDIYLGKEKTSEEPEEISLIRGKRYYGSGVCPFVVLPLTREYPGKRNPYSGYLDETKYPYHYLTQVELAVGLGVTIRAGVNPGELLDFLLGWIGLDLYSDDLSRLESQ